MTLKKRAVFAKGKRNTSIVLVFILLLISLINPHMSMIIQGFDTSQIYSTFYLLYGDDDITKGLVDSSLVTLNPSLMEYFKENPFDYETSSNLVSNVKNINVFIGSDVIKSSKADISFFNRANHKNVNSNYGFDLDSFRYGHILSHGLERSV